uniref:SRPBCC domain-containing protein n=1 Tax=Rhodothermus marinus TaxID=29549 RepID=A0A7V2B1Z0_RHOMR
MLFSWMPLVTCSTTQKKSMNPSRSLIAPVTDRVIYVNALLSVPPARAFEYFTRADLLTEWLTAAAEIDPKVSGKYELFWEPTTRENNSTIGCRITAIEANQLFAFQWRLPKRFRTFANGPDPLTHMVVVCV